MNNDHSRVVVIHSTKTSGKAMCVGFCTTEELMFILSEMKSIFLVKMDLRLVRRSSDAVPLGDVCHLSM